MIITNLLSDRRKYDLHYTLQNRQKTRDSVGECALEGIPDRFLIGRHLPRDRGAAAHMQPNSPLWRDLGAKCCLQTSLKLHCSCGSPACVAYRCYFRRPR